MGYTDRQTSTLGAFKFSVFPCRLTYKKLVFHIFIFLLNRSMSIYI